MLSYQKNRALRLACLKSAENRSARRISDITKSKVDAAEDIGESLSNRDLLLLGVGLYWGEGYKNGNTEFGFTNSDPEMVRVYLKILKEVYKIEADQLTLKININQLFAENQSEIEKYWQAITKISSDQFTKTTLIQSKLNRKYNIDGYKGTIRIKVKRGEFLKTRVLESVKKIQEITR